jgi:hypothetical protein
MEINIAELSKYPICDTDIWVNLCLGGLLSEVFKLHSKLVVADVVEGEILNWRKSGKYCFIADEFQKYKKNGHILVIEHDKHIPAPQRKILERILYDLKFQNDFKNKPPEENKGEFVSAIYADYFKIPFMKSNDNAFQEGGKGREAFPDLLVKNWNDTLRELLKDDRQRISIAKKVEEENKRMNQSKNTVDKHNKGKNDISMDEMLEQLKQRFSKNY